MSALRLCVQRWNGNAKCMAIGIANNASIAKPIGTGLTTQQSVRSICHKDHMDPEVVKNKSKAWDWENKRYSWIDQYVLKRDKCVYRWDENTKIIAVEGNIASGKTTFAKKLADELGMKYVKEPDFDDMYIDRFGFDYRTLNWRLPEWVQAVDYRLFYENPKHQGWPTTHLMQYGMRYFYYHQALAHLFSTGQGIVIERSPWTDYVFVEAGYKMGFYPRDFKDYMWQLRADTENHLLRTHLVIYLDVSPEESLKRIKKRAIDYEVSPKNQLLQNTKYLEAIEDAYKTFHLPWIQNHAELIVYDWTRFGDMDLVVEDLERLDFDQYEARGEKMEDWRIYMTNDYDELRRKYTSWWTYMYKEFNRAVFDIPSLCCPPECMAHFENVMANHGPKYHPQYDPEKHGAFNIMFKTWGNYLERRQYNAYSPYHK